MQNAIPELWESPFLHCPLRPGEKFEHSAHNWNSKLQSSPTNHKQVLVCRRLSKAGTVGIWALLPTRSYTRCGWIHDRSRRPRGNADVKCSPSARWLRSVVCQRCPGARMQSHWCARAARSGAARGPPSNSAAASLRGEGTVSPTKQFPVVLHPLTHPSTRDVFKILAHRRFTWKF